jgi:ABC-type transport system involved in Fe-S cluster assembly fused permease/ATPase subunit
LDSWAFYVDYGTPFYSDSDLKDSSTFFLTIYLEIEKKKSPIWTFSQLFPVATTVKSSPHAHYLHIQLYNVLTSTCVHHRYPTSLLILVR